jgi:8-oxo-dGTP pyrophosphatase MutT (NUDIX family)
MSNDYRALVRDKLAAHPRKQIEAAVGSPAGVLIPLFEKGGKIHVLLTLRTNTVASHKGQISFPGGGSEAGDRDITATALRETFEEVGIEPSSVEVLGRLDDVVAISNYVVTPVVGVIPYPSRYRISTDEIAEVIEAPLDFFMDTRNCRVETRVFRGKDVPVYFYQYKEHNVWGLTAYMLRCFLEVCYGVQR